MEADGSVSKALREALWIGPSRSKMPAGYEPLFGLKLVANTNDYEEAGAGAAGLRREAIKPARTLSANRMVWEEEPARHLGEMSEDLRKGFELWTRNYCRRNRAMMDRAAELFLWIFRQEEWEDLVALMDGEIEGYLSAALDRLLEGDGETAVTTLGDRILESENVFALQLNVFGFAAVRAQFMEAVAAE